MTDCMTFHYDDNYLKYVGWKNTVQDNGGYAQLFTRENLERMQKKITELLEGVDRNGRNIIVPLDKIAHIVTQVLNSNNPIVGDIYTRYIIQGIEEYRNDVRDIIDRSINIIVSQVRDTLEVEQNNKELTVWTTVYGDFNEHSLRQHPPIKLKKRRSDRMFFNMNY